MAKDREKLSSLGKRGRRVVKVILPREVGLYEHNKGDCSFVAAFGVCALCEGFEHVDIGRDNWGICRTHKIKWRFGNNLLSNWRDQTLEQKQAVEELLRDYTEVKDEECAYVRDMDSQHASFGGAHPSPLRRGHDYAAEIEEVKT